MAKKKKKFLEDVMFMGDLVDKISEDSGDLVKQAKGKKKR